MADAEAMDVEEAQPAPGEAKEGASSKGAGSGKRFEIKKWNAVAMWSWAICTDTCAICRNNLYEPSIEYQANPTGGPALQRNALSMCCRCPRLTICADAAWVRSRFVEPNVADPASA